MLVGVSVSVSAGLVLCSLCGVVVSGLCFVLLVVSLWLFIYLVLSIVDCRCTDCQGND